MRIHFIIPSKGGDQPGFTSQALLEEGCRNSLFSYAYADYERYQHKLWTGWQEIVNDIDRTRLDRSG